jgi:hypothetical protein
VADHDFVFALEMSDDAESGKMLGEVCAAVLGHVGYAAADVTELTASLAAAVSPAAGGTAHRCGVRFVARGGELQIVVARAGQPDWRATRPLPHS